jgi:hypothetical protein
MLNAKHLRCLAVGLFLTSVLTVVVGSLLPALAPPAGMDKPIHLGAYALLALLAGVAFPRVAPAAGLAGLIVLGSAVELSQGALVAGRLASAEDALMNAVGASLGCGFALALRRLLSSRPA